jgi:hypothetical protein
MKDITYLGQQVRRHGELRAEGLLLQQVAGEAGQTVALNVQGDLVGGEREQHVVGAHTEQHLVHPEQHKYQ